MKNITRWSISNSPAINILMITVMLVGLVCTLRMRREDFPAFELEIVLVTVPYPGATPEEAEEGICQKIEEAVRGIDGVDKVTSVAAEGTASVVLELSTRGADPDRVLDEVRSEVDRIPSFPLEAEDPEIRRLTLRAPTIRIGVLGPDREGPQAELDLREVAEGVRNALLQQPSISLVDFLGAKDYQIDIEISEERLRAHGLSLQQVAEIVRRENRQLPAGTLRSPAQEMLLRADNRRTVGEQIAELPLVSDPTGAVLTVGDLGTVRDEFADGTLISRINKRPAVALSVQKTDTEDMLQIVNEVQQSLAEQRSQLPPGYELTTWGDRTVEVRGRINLLLENGGQGLCLVFLLLAVFLELRLAFWVASGIPFALLATSIYLYFADQTLNMLSMFGFVMALGIVVDDAIVVGENIYAHRQMKKKTPRAALDGAVEVLPSVTASVSTTVIAFMPLLFVSGVMGKFMAVMPVAIIGMLVVSLFECLTILPCHLAHEDSLLFRLMGRLVRPFRWTAAFLATLLAGAGLLWLLAGSDTGLALLDRVPRLRAGVGERVRELVVAGSVVVLALGALNFAPPVFRHLNRWATAGLMGFVDRVYTPTLALALRNRAPFVALCVAVLILSVGMVRAGMVPFAIFPKLDGNSIQASIAFPDGTPGTVSDRWTKRIEAAILDLDRQYREDGRGPIVATTYRIVGQQVGADQGPAQQENAATGSHVGSVEVELFDVSRRPESSALIIKQWRDAVGPVPGAESLKFQALNMGPGGIPIEFKLLADSRHVEELEAAVERCKQRLGEEPGVFDIADDSAPGKWELRMRVKEDAIPLGVRNADLAETVRASYYGDEVMRLQRGRHEVKLMVRYPAEQRRSLSDLDEVRIRTNDGVERPLTEVADVEIVRGYSEINRVDQLRSITVSADLDEDAANARQIVADLKQNFVPEVLAAEFPNVQVRWEGQQQQTQESVGSLMTGLMIALLGMFMLLVIEFKSYLQPLLVMAVIPFGMIGAVAGHWVQGLQLTMFSLFGLVALTGIVVNDSIVLIDFINHRVRDGMPVREALLEAGRRRFRPVMLTTITTVAGLLPILLERSLQAQVLIPMATSIAFGELFATVLVLYLVPVAYSLYAAAAGTEHEDLEAELAG